MRKILLVAAFAAVLTISAPQVFAGHVHSTDRCTSEGCETIIIDCPPECPEYVPPPNDEGRMADASATRSSGWLDWLLSYAR